MLCGLLTPDSGRGPASASTSSASWPRSSAHRLHDPAFSLYEDLTIARTCSSSPASTAWTAARERVDDRARSPGTRGAQDQLAGSLSGGWKQRLALAASTLHEPRLLLLDEPTAGVDPKARRTFWDEIHALSADGLTVLVSTHYMDEAERCHEIAYISYGKLIARGTAEEVIEASNLVTLRGEGPGIDRLAEEVAARPGVLTAAPSAPPCTSAAMTGRPWRRP
jgi:ABC-2 type transport system ATP-binding protein